MTETAKTGKTRTPMDRSSEQDVVAPSTPVKDFLKQDVEGVATDSGFVKTRNTSNILQVYFHSVVTSSVGPDDGDSRSSIPDYQCKDSPSLDTPTINAESCAQSNDTLTPEKDSSTLHISLSQQSDNTQLYRTPANSDEWNTSSNDIPSTADFKVSTAHQQSDHNQVHMTPTNNNEVCTQSNDTLNLVQGSSLPNSDNSQLFVTPTDSIQSCTQSNVNLTSVQDPIASDHQDAVNQLPIATPAPPTSVNTRTTADLDPEQATHNWEFSESELVCDFQPPSVDIMKMLTSMSSSETVLDCEAVLDCEKPFPDSFNSQGDGYVLPALSCCPRRRVPDDVLRRETQQ